MAGMTSLGHAAYFGIAAYAVTWLHTIAGCGHLSSAIGAVAVATATAAIFGVLALRASGLSFLMITLALGQIVWGVPIAGWADAGRQWHAVSGSAGALRLQHQRGDELLLLLAHRLRDLGLPHLAGGEFALRRGPARHKGPAAPHAHARPQCLDDPLGGVRNVRLLGGGRRAAVRLFQNT